jgi:hypothetical protein
VAISNGYATLNDVKSALRISDSIDDGILELSIEAASREIDGYCERRFYQTTGTAVYIPQDSFTTEIDDLYTLTTLKTSPDGSGFTQTWAASDYQLEPLNRLSGGIVSPYTRIRAIGAFTFPVWEPNNVNNYEATVEVVGTFGWGSIPVAIKQATILLAMRQYRRYDSPLGVAGFDDVGIIRVGRVDPDVQRLIDPFRKVRMA